MQATSVQYKSAFNTSNSWKFITKYRMSYGGDWQICYVVIYEERYLKLWVAHAPGMPGAFSPPQRVSDPNMHHGTCVTHVPWRIPGSLTSGFLWSRWWGKRARHSQRMRNLQFFISFKGPIAVCKLRRKFPRGKYNHEQVAFRQFRESVATLINICDRYKKLLLSLTRFHL